MNLPKLPNEPIPFLTEGAWNRYEFSPEHRYWCRLIAFRPPKKGEYYLWKGEAKAYVASKDMTDPHWIVQKIESPPSLHEVRVEWRPENLTSPEKVATRRDVEHAFKNGWLTGLGSDPDEFGSHDDKLALLEDYWADYCRTLEN